MITHDYGWGLWLIIICMGLVTIANRSLFVVCSQWIELPRILRSTLKYTPASALAAIAVPEVFIQQGVLDFSWHNYYLIASIVGLILSFLVRNTLAAIIGGMLVLYALRYFN